MANMQNFLVIASVDGKDYLVRVTAESAYSAEHQILDHAYCGIHEYGVDGAHTFNIDTMRTDIFRNLAISCDTVSMTELVQIINERNRDIKEKDEAEKRIREIEKQMKKLSEELEDAKRILAN